MLRTIRIGTAIFCFVLITILFLDFTGTFHRWLGWLAKIQFIPALLALNVGIMVALVVLTLLFGRIYCSVICSLGILQDGISYMSGRRKGKRNRFRYSKAKTWFRYSVFVLFIAMLVAGVSLVVSLLDPYAVYGRIASNFFIPLYRLGNNLLAFFAEKADSYAFYSTDVWIKSWITFGIAVVMFALVWILSWRGGRTYCNTVCPVGIFLGFLSRFSIFRPKFNKDKCTKCGLCEKGCKASCIDSKNMVIDLSRCVVCFNCMEECKFGAMTYSTHKIGTKKEIKPETIDATSNSGEGISRRGFLSIAGAFALASTVKAQKLQADGGLAVIEDKKIPNRKTPLIPPGAIGLQHIKQHCTACQLCVSACPNNILRPSAKLSTLMQPEMSYERGYCRPECTECSQVCPTGAIEKITPVQKSAISIGTAVWIKDNCVVNRDNIQCNNCERHCPTGAIMMVAMNSQDEKSLKIPVVDKELCIGCGACEYLCPGRPFSAIYVEGNVRHHSM